MSSRFRCPAGRSRRPLPVHVTYTALLCSAGSRNIRQLESCLSASKLTTHAAATGDLLPDDESAKLHSCRYHFLCAAEGRAITGAQRAMRIATTLRDSWWASRTVCRVQIEYLLFPAVLSVLGPRIQIIQFCASASELVEGCSEANLPRRVLAASSAPQAPRSCARKPSRSSARMR